MNGRIDFAELNELNAWRARSPLNEQLFEELTDPEKSEAAVKKMQAYDVQGKLEAVHATQDELAIIKLHKRNRNRRMFFYLTAASVLLAVWLMAHYLNKPTDYRNNDRFIALQDVAPGKNQATLTLSDGKKIKLSEATNGALAKEAGITISKAEDGQLVYEIASIPRNDGSGSSSRGKEGSPGNATTNTLSTANGETYQVRLPDGTKVWLNAASSITYAAALSERGTRNLKLEGEAYLEVAKNKARPFIVETSTQQIEVLGTHFNVNAYADEGRTVTTLLEGSVKVGIASAAGKPRHDVILKPGEQAINTVSKIQTVKADLTTAVAWKDGEFIFKNASVPEILRQVARWYNLEIVYQGKITTDTFTGSIDRNSNLENVLKLFETAQIKFNVEQTRNGKKLILKSN